MPAYKKILVCDKCLRASCWYGEFMCDDAQGAGTGLLTTQQLKKLDREHPDFWSRRKFMEIYGEPNPDMSDQGPDLTPAYLRALEQHREAMDFPDLIPPTPPRRKPALRGSAIARSLRAWG